MHKESLTKGTVRMPAAVLWFARGFARVQCSAMLADEARVEKRGHGSKERLKKGGVTLKQK